jgi:uncharacterized linocin/CFP29 family protein
MDHLRRELAPVSQAAWTAIEQEAANTLKEMLAARKLVDFEGPLGWEASSIDLGRVQRLEAGPQEGVEARLRKVLPLVELRAVFTLSRDELEALDRGAPDVDLQPVVEAARSAALAEDKAVFYGLEAAGITGIAQAAPQTLALSDDYLRYPDVVAQALERLRSAGIAGPYAIALGPRCYTGLTQTRDAGYPVIEHVRRLLDGPIVWAPAADGAIVLSLRGGDFRLSMGQDFSIGYLDHDEQRVRLYIEETCTFHVNTPEAAVPLRYAG